jgi:hypothetical protein
LQTQKLAVFHDDDKDLAAIFTGISANSCFGRIRPHARLLRERLTMQTCNLAGPAARFALQPVAMPRARPPLAVKPAGRAK